MDFAPKTYADCWTFKHPITASAVNINLSAVFPAPANGAEWTQRNLDMVARNSTIGATIATAVPFNHTGTYSLFFEYCQPKSGAPKGVFQAVHGGGATAAYWDPYVLGDDHIYSFIDTAAAAGWATLAYDRLGVGQSDHPDGMNIVQQPLEIEQAAEIARQLRSSELGNGVPTFDTIVGIGHSYGTGVLTGAAGPHPSAWDALVLTGDTGDLAAFAEIGGMGPQGLAKEVKPEKWGHLSGAWTSTMNERGDQAEFFHYPNYTEAALKAFTETKGETSLGQAMTTGVFFSLTRPDYHNPTMVVTGANDQVACASRCDITVVPGFSNQIEAAKNMFPGVADADFEAVLIPAAGHGINFHTTAYDAYQQILEFVGKHF